MPTSSPPTPVPLQLSESWDSDSASTRSQQTVTDGSSETLRPRGSRQLLLLLELAKQRTSSSSSVPTELLPRELSPSQEPPLQELPPQEPPLQEHLGVPIPRKASHDDHPEPELLATSAGDHSGGLIPLLSTISLLELSLDAEVPKTTPGDYRTGGVLGATTPHRVPSAALLLTWGARAVPRQLQRVPSMTPIGARPVVSRRLSTQAMAPGSGTAAAGAEPDLPNLDPTLVTGSPLRMWLNPQTPPPMALGVNPGRLQPAVQPIFISNSGDKSPPLLPVNTPHEAPPMTPLLLNMGQLREDLEEETEETGRRMSRSDESSDDGVHMDL